MTLALAIVVVALYGLTLLLLLPFAAHRVVVLALSRRPRPLGDAIDAHGIPDGGHGRGSRAADESPCDGPDSPRPAPRVTVQLPIYNERDVVERLIDAACQLEHPAARLQIQVLDDSTDDTTPLAERRARRWRRRGVDIAVLHRTERKGYKAGALAEAMPLATGDFVLVLDADFTPPPSLLRDLLPEMADPGVGMVQARWDHINEGASWLTRAQALILDGHFLVEQRGRYRGGRFFNFNGTAGLWRREALVDAGGWQPDTLTEDLDASYRAQMAGWRFVMRDDVGVPGELPGTVRSLLVQQRRWAQGGIQTARKILPGLLRGPWRPTVKLGAVAHLCAHLAHPLAILLAFLIVPAALARRELGLEHLWWIDVAVFGAATAPFMAYYWTAATRRERRARWRGRWAGRGVRIVLAFVLAAGLSLLLAPAALRGLRAVRDPFRRTPKAGGRARSSYESSGRGYLGRGRAVACGVVATGLCVAGAAAGAWGALPFAGLFAMGYLALGLQPGLGG